MNAPPPDNGLNFYGGRARFNRQRQDIATERRSRLAILMRGESLFQRGWKARLAKKLNCHRSTIGRDIRVLAAESKQRRRLKNRSLQDQLDRIANRVHAEMLAAAGVKMEDYSGQ